MSSVSGHFHGGRGRATEQYQQPMTNSGNNTGNDFRYPFFVFCLQSR